MALFRRWPLILIIGLGFTGGFVVPAGANSAEFPPAILLDDPLPQPPFTQEVEVRLQPVFQNQVLGEEMAAVLTMKNLSPGSVRLPMGRQDVRLIDLRMQVDPVFAALHGISFWSGYEACSICAPIVRLLPGKTEHTIILIDHYLTFTKLVRPPVPVTWRLTLRNGQEKSGRFILNLATPTDQLDEVMEQQMHQQDKHLATLEIELPSAP